MTDNVATEVRQILVAHGRLAVAVDTLSDHDDLYYAGMTSQANVNVMLALEAAFDIEFPESLLRRSTFESMGAICTAVTSLLGDSESESVA